MSEEQVRLGRAISEKIDLNHIEADEIYRIAETIECNVVTMIGVIEHLKYPVKMIQALKENNNIQYLYCTFPMFSPAVYFELTFPEVMSRHLALGHTHLFQESSIDELAQKGDFERCAEWWFGQDIIDLVRSIEITVDSSSESEQMSDHWQKMSYYIVDDLQMVIDENKKSSSVHILFKSN